MSNVPIPPQEGMMFEYLPRQTSLPQDISPSSFIISALKTTHLMKFMLCESAVSFGTGFYQMEATRTLVHNCLAHRHTLTFSILDQRGSKKANENSARTT